MQVSTEEDEAVMAEEGVPVEFRTFLNYLFGEVLGHNAYVTDGVQRALGREPRDFLEYARDAAATGVWNASAVTASSAGYWPSTRDIGVALNVGRRPAAAPRARSKRLKQPQTLDGDAGQIPLDDESG